MAWGALLIILFFLLWVRFYSEIHRIDQSMGMDFRCRSVDLVLSYSLIHFDTLMDMFNETGCLKRLITVEFSVDHPDVIIFVRE